MKDPKTCGFVLPFSPLNETDTIIFLNSMQRVLTDGERCHLNGSTGSVSWRTAAAWKHSAASRADKLPPSSLWSKPRWCQADALVRSSRRASVRKLLMIAGDLQLLPLRTLALETRLGTCIGSTSRASVYAFRASFSLPFASWRKPAFVIQKWVPQLLGGVSPSHIWMSRLASSIKLRKNQSFLLVNSQHESTIWLWSLELLSCALWFLMSHKSYISCIPSWERRQASENDLVNGLSSTCLL